MSSDANRTLLSWLAERSRVGGTDAEHTLGFKPTWSESALRKLRRVADDVTRPVAARFAAIRLHGVSGRQMQGLLGLRELVAEQPGPVVDNDHLYINLIVSLLELGQLELAAAIIHLKLGCTGWLDVGFDPARDRNESVVRWTIHSRDRCSFRFSARVFGAPSFEMYVDRWLACLPAFVAYRHSPGFLTGEISVNLGDRSTAPGGLGFCANDPRHFLIPDSYFLSSSGYSDLRAHYAAHDVPWAERRDIAFWRGATTGGSPNKSTHWRDLPRVRLCMIAQQRPDLFDVGLSRVAQVPNPEDVKAIIESGLMRKSVETTDFGRYRFQIDIDGNTNSWPGLFQKLLSGSPILKVDSPQGFRQWYYDRLQPWVNYVPVASDMSDLIEKAEWLRANEEQARSIGSKGRELATELSYEAELARCARTISGALAQAADGGG
jgi:hypothetical protein